MTTLVGKKLLVISSDSSDLEFVKAAKELGIYVVCCDRYEDWRKSPAKLAADEAWNIDYTDIEAVASKCIENHIDGVIAGYSEDRVLAACRISKAINTPFYATEEQINFTRNKKLFKKACEQCGLMVPKEFCHRLPLTEDDLAQIEYPVIVKPSDSGGRKGISVCNSEDQLRVAIEYAQENSKNGDVIIEEYLTGLELSAIYTLVDGEISLSCLNDKYISRNSDEISTLCDFVITPSKYYAQFTEEVDEKLKALLKSIGAKNGVANFQLIATPNAIKAFEMGYRVNGNNDFKVIQKYNGIDFLKMLITYCITGNMGCKLENDNPKFPEYYCTYVIHLSEGTINKIEYQGLLDSQEMDDISIWKKAGETIRDTGTTAQKAGMIKFAAKTYEDVVSKIALIDKTFVIEDEVGADLCMSRFDSSRLMK